MNNFRAIHIDYIRPSRTIETILVDNEDKEDILYVYNYEGICYRVFLSFLALMIFFNKGRKSDYIFDTEEELDCFLSQIKLL